TSPYTTLFRSKLAQFLLTRVEVLAARMHLERDGPCADGLLARAESSFVELDLEVSQESFQRPREVGAGRRRSTRIVRSDMSDRRPRERLGRVGLAGMSAGAENRGVDLNSGRSVVEGGDQIETQLAEIGELLAVEGLGDQMREHEPHTAKASLCSTNALELRQIDAARRAEH